MAVFSILGFSIQKKSKFCPRQFELELRTETTICGAGKAGIFFGNKFGYGAKFNRTEIVFGTENIRTGAWTANSTGPPLEEGWIEWFTQKPDSSFLHVGWNRT